MSEPSLKKEQLQAVNRNGGDTLVSASAGSGKTHVMISRAVRLVCEGQASVDEILAVTFTETAAADMKEKLKKELIKKINTTKDERLAKQLGLLPTANISTLHAFCVGLIRSYFFECGVSPDFAIADDSVSSSLKTDAVNKLFGEKYASADDDFLTVLNFHRHKRSDAVFKELIISLYDFCESEAYPDGLLDEGLKYCTESGFNELLKIFKEKIDATLIKIKATLESLNSVFDGKPKLEELKNTLIDDLDSVLSSDDVYVVKKFQDYKRDFLKVERALSEEEKNGKEILKNCRDLIKKNIETYNEYFTDREEDGRRCVQQRLHLRILSQSVKRFTEIYSQLKRDENVLDFADLEHFALKILANEDICKAVKERYKYVFVDEYQDTNGVQEEIINYIKNDNLFMVGDVKQSIYGFRGCRPEFFQNKFNVMSDTEGATVKLNYNFRSSKAVIDMVNKVFDYSMTADLFGVDYKSTSRLIDGGIYGDGNEGRAKFHYLKINKERSKEKEVPRVYDILDEIIKKQDDVTETAALVANIIYDELHQKYYDVKEDAYKNVTLKDIAVLSRSKNSEYFRGLVSGLIKRGIDVETDSVGDICDYPEIRVLVSVLKLIDCFVQDIPLATVLKSVVGGFSDEELARISLTYSDYCNSNKMRFTSFYDAYAFCRDNLDNALGVKLKRFDEEFSDLRRFADFTSAGAVLEKVMDKCNYKACLFASEFGESKVKRVERFVSASSRGGRRLSVKEFLDYAETDGSEINLSECNGENSVKIMTVHASKGLEFPVVIVCGLERRANDSDERDEVYTDRLYGIGVKYYDREDKLTYETPLRGLIKERMREERRREELRLFYVALTRAKYSLHMTYVGGEIKRKLLDYADRFIDYVPNDLERQDRTLDELLITDTVVPECDGFGALAIDGKKIERLKKNFEYVYPYSADTVLPLKTSVTETLENSVESLEGYSVKKLFSDDTAATKTDALRGITAHKLLENIDFDNADDFEGEINRIIKSGIIKKEELDKIDLRAIKRVLSNDVFKKIKGKKTYKEKSFIAQVPSSVLFDNGLSSSVLVQGVIDLLVTDGDTAKIIDYKYSSKSAPALKEKYFKQLEIYSYVTEKVLGLKVTERIIVSLLTGECIAVD